MGFFEEGQKDKAAKLGVLGWGLKGFRDSKSERRLMGWNGFGGLLNQLWSLNGLKLRLNEAIERNTAKGF